VSELRPHACSRRPVPLAPAGLWGRRRRRRRSHPASRPGRRFHPAHPPNNDYPTSWTNDESNTFYWGNQAPIGNSDGCSRNIDIPPASGSCVARRDPVADGLVPRAPAATASALPRPERTRGWSTAGTVPVRRATRPTTRRRSTTTTSGPSRRPIRTSSTTTGWRPGPSSGSRGCTPRTSPFTLVGGLRAAPHAPRRRAPRP
jgi:hypothetical protein